MPTFQLENNDINRAVGSFLEKTHDDLNVQVSKDRIVVKAKFAVELSKLELGSAIPTLTDMDWARLYRQISKTVKGGRVWPPRRNFDRAETWVIRVKLLRTRRVEVLFDSLDYEMVKEAAKLANKTVTDFIRTAVMLAVDQEYDKETMRKQREKQQQQQATEQQPSESKYVS